MKKALGIIAGGGQFPFLVAQRAKEMGIKTVGLGFKGQTSPSLASQLDKYQEIRIGQLGRLISFFQKQGVQEIVFVGKINKPQALWQAFPDVRALKLWKRLSSRHDDHILRAVAQELEKEGFKVVSPTKYLDYLVTPVGVLTQKAPSKEQYKDIVFGWSMAKAIGKLDIGQCVVVKDKSVVAVEAMEGTDATIHRAGELLPDTIVVKVCKPKQDLRFDLPSVGLKTIESMIQAQAKVLALEAHKSLFFDRQEALSLANKAGIVVIGLSEEGGSFV